MWETQSNEIPFVSSEQWAIKKDMDIFVPQMSATAMSAAEIASSRNTNLAEAWAVASAVNALCEKIVTEDIMANGQWEDIVQLEPEVVIAHTEFSVSSVIDDLCDCVANHTEGGDGSGKANVDFCEGKGFIHNRTDCECDMCTCSRYVFTEPRAPFNSPPPRIQIDNQTRSVVRELFPPGQGQDILGPGWTSYPGYRLCALSRCQLCDFTIHDISARQTAEHCDWRLCGPREDVEPEFVCVSCTFPGHRCCECGLSSSLYDHPAQHFTFVYDGINGTDEIESAYCPSCALEAGIIESSDDESEEEDANFIDEDDEDDAVYTGQYELVDEPEDNSVKMTEIKEIVKHAGSHVFDLQEKLNEGEYLTLMDLLQKITNVANR